MGNKVMKIDLIGLAATWTLTATQLNEVFQLVQLILSCIATLIIIVFTIWKWYKGTTADGKITADEIQDGIDVIKDGVDQIDNITKKGDK